MNQIEPALDHLVYAVPDLGSAVEEFRAGTGLQPAEGGRHLGRGTRNYLVGLGPTSYLEIIGPDPENPVAAGLTMPFGLETLGEQRLLTWAVRPRDIHRAVRDSATAGADLGEPTAMSRRTPTGELLEWVLATAVPLPLSGVTPFLIDWGRSSHPATDANLPQATLVEFTGTYPDPVGVERVLTALDVVLTVVSGPPGLHAVLQTPQSNFRLGCPESHDGRHR